MCRLMILLRSAFHSYGEIITVDGGLRGLGYARWSVPLGRDYHDIAYKTKQNPVLKRTCFLLKLQISQAYYCIYALKSTDGVYRKVFSLDPRGIFEILRFLGTVHCESHSM
jgi:hypothetical protein